MKNNLTRNWPNNCIRLCNLDLCSKRKIAKLFANSEDPDRTSRSGSVLFAIYPFGGLD